MPKISEIMIRIVTKKEESDERIAVQNISFRLETRKLVALFKRGPRWPLYRTLWGHILNFKISKEFLGGWLGT